MRTALTTLTEELRRLKAAGVKTVAVSDDGLAALRRVVTIRNGGKRNSPLTVTVSDKPEGSTRATAAFTPRAYEPPAPVYAAKSAPVSTNSPLPSPPIFQLPAGDKQARWDALFALVQGDATCRAHVRPGKKIVLGVGNLDAKIMFVGEAPGAEEELKGEPFVGPAGQLLTKMILGMGLKRTDVYIGNIMNWRPEIPTTPGAEQVGNRAPTEDEIRYCLPYLRAQIEVVNPGLLVALGATATHGLLGFGTFKALGDVRGRWHEFAGRPLMVTYHPSYILREPTNRKKRLIWDDLLKVMERAVLPISDKQRGYFLDK